MSKAGGPYDNAKAESFFRTLKKEEVYLSQCRDFEEARASLGYLPPTEFEASFDELTCASNG